MMFRKATIKDIFNGKSLVYILLDNENIIRYFAVSIDNKSKMCSLDFTAIKREYQGKGYANKIKLKQIEIAKKNKCKIIELSTWVKNHPIIGINKIKLII